MTRVLLIEDAKHLAEAIGQVFRQRNIVLDVASDGQTGLDYALTGEHDAIICDIMLPGVDGLTIVHTLRERGLTTPILMLTALGETADRVRGLDSGADDYLTKPFEMEELLARVRALARRSPHAPDTMAASAPGDPLVFGDLSYDLASLKALSNGRSFDLTPKEGALLELLLRNTDRLLSKEQIITQIWPFDAEATGSHVENYISFLRKKLTAAHSAVAIKTVRGAGYQLTDSLKEGDKSDD
jgi:DNA-binding response OmpR family regulator